jgi:hypothetical protein
VRERMMIYQSLKTYIQYFLHSYDPIHIDTDYIKLKQDIDEFPFYNTAISIWDS